MISKCSPPAFYSGALQARAPSPVPGVGVVPARQEPRPRRRLRPRHHRAVQRRLLPRHLHRPHGARRKELQQGKGHLQVGRHRAGQQASPFEFPAIFEIGSTLLLVAPKM